MYPICCKNRSTEARAYNSILVETIRTCVRADDSALYEEIYTAAQSNNVLIVGDFSWPNGEWSLMARDQEDSRLIEMIKDSSLTQVITQLIRGSTVLDLVLVTNPDLMRDCEMGERMNDCYYHSVRFSVNIESKFT